MANAERAQLPATPENSRDENPHPLSGGACPWIGYDEQNEATIARFVAKSSPSQAREVGAYERANGDRPSVIDAADQRLAKWKA